jgi:hypothetical protein
MDGVMVMPYVAHMAFICSHFSFVHHWVSRFYFSARVEIASGRRQGDDDGFVSCVDSGGKKL